MARKKIIYTIGDLKKAIAKYDDKDEVLLEIDDDDYVSRFFVEIFSVNLQMEDGTKVREVRLCATQETSVNDSDDNY